MEDNMVERKKERNFYKESTIESLLAELKEYGYTRQHGRAGKELDDPEAEKRRLYNNLMSRKARAAKRELIKDKAKRVVSIVKQDDYEQDINGINAKDRRRYNLCFTAGIQGIPVERDYIRRMTGLDDIQIDILAKETGLIPANPVTW